jgi:hypothetical protein
MYNQALESNTSSFEVFSVALLALLNKITEFEGSRHPQKNHCVFAGVWSELHCTLGPQRPAEGAVLFYD